MAIGEFLHQSLNQRGSIVMNAAVKTSKGTKVADVAWFSPERWEQVKDEFDASIAPEICVEVLSPRNSKEEIEQKEVVFRRGCPRGLDLQRRGGDAFLQ